MSEFPPNLGQAILQSLRGMVSADCFRNWFQDLTVLGRDGAVLHLGVPSRYTKYWLESHYRKDLLRAAQAHMAEITSVDLLIQSQRLPATESSATMGQVLGALPADASMAALKVQPSVNTSIRPSRDGFSFTPLASRLRLESFQVGKCSRVAMAAAQTVAESPASVYNPLCIHGGHGLGKTHLLHGIGHLLQERRPPHNVIYISCEEFTNLYVQAVQTKRLDAFRQRFRNCDALLLDDIQFLAGKDRTQEEFLHTFDALKNAQKQIVIASDVAPRELKRIDPKLLTRLQSGLVAQVEAPDPVLRAELLQTKARLRGISLSNDVCETLASHISGNVRELEGAVCKLMALAAAEIRTPDRELAIIALRELGYLRSGPLTLLDILTAVSSHFSISADELRGSKRHASVVHARHVGMYLSKMLTSQSVAEIGRFYGNRDHATVLHATRKLADMLKRDEALRTDLEKLRQVLGR